MLMPGVLLFMAGATTALRMSLITISMFIVMENVNRSFVLLMLHALLLMGALALFYFSLSEPLLFVFACAGFVFVSAWFTRFGAHLKSFGNFIFIPALYMACEMADASGRSGVWADYFHIVIWMGLPIASIALLLCLHAWPDLSQAPKDTNRFSKIFALHTSQPLCAYKRLALSHFLSVLCAAAYAEIGAVPFSEWIIWSAVSVGTGDQASSLKKARDRFLGALLGVPIALLIAPIVPHGATTLSLLTLGVGLSLVVFKNYAVAFGTRCGFTVLAAFSAGALGTRAGFYRVENVIIGGVIGVLVGLLVEFFSNRYSKSKDISV